MTGRLIRVGGGLLLGLIAVATLKPVSTIDSAAWFLTLDAADAVRNVIMFVPVGILVVLVRMRPQRAFWSCVLFSAAIETAQFWIPGRFASPGDILMNALGGAIGIALMRSAPGWLEPEGLHRRILPVLVGGAAAGGIFLTSVLIQPQNPGPPYHCDYQPRVPRMVTWTGTVLGARLGELKLVDVGLLDREQTEREVQNGSVLALELLRGRQQTRAASILMLAGHDHEELWLVVTRGDDVAFRVGSVADRLGFHGPLLRFPGALEGVAPGRRFALRAQALATGGELRVDDSQPVAVHFSAGDGWRHYAGPSSDLRRRSLPNAAWLALIFLPLGFFRSSRSGFLIGVAFPLAMLLMLPALGRLGWPSWVEWLGPLAGVLVGVALRPLVKRIIAFQLPAEPGETPGS